jgi:hypothetical protein
LLGCRGRLVPELSSPLRRRFFVLSYRLWRGLRLRFLHRRLFNNFRDGLSYFLLNGLLNGLGRRRWWWLRRVDLGLIRQQRARDRIFFQLLSRKRRPRGFLDRLWFRFRLRLRLRNRFGLGLGYRC